MSRALLSWASALLVVALLGGLYLLGRTQGREAERAEWVKHTTAAALQASEAARIKEQERLRASEIIERNHMATVEKLRAAAGGARGELDRLRLALAERDRAGRDAAAAGRADDAARERELLGACAAEYQSMARDADELAARLSGLQSYVRQVVRPGQP